MPRMRSVDAAVATMVKEGVDVVFGLPGAAMASLQGLAALSLMTYSCVLIAANGFNPFIYFRF